LGLYDCRVAQNVPDWYTVDSFRTASKRHCEMLVEERLEPTALVGGTN